MEANTVQQIRFVRTKGGHFAAIINDTLSVVKRADKIPVYSLYQNIAKGVTVESTPKLVAEFTDAYYRINQEAKEASERIAREKRETKERELQKFKDTVKGMTPSDFADFMKLDRHETAGHWSDLHEGRSSYAVSFSDREEYEAFLIAQDVNGWEGEFGELKHRAGEHHRQFSSVWDLEAYQRGVENYFDEKFFYKDKETEEEFFLERIKEAEDMEEVLELTKEYQSIEAGYYDNSNELILKGNDFDEMFGYSYDVYNFRFGFNFPSQDYFYNGSEEETEIEL